MKIVWATIVVLTGLLPAYSQVYDTVSRVHLSGHYFSDNGIVLRWAPTDPGIWRKCNYYGYRLERTELNTINSVEMGWSVLVDTLKPKSFELWSQAVKENPDDTLLMIAGQAIYGEISTETINLTNLRQKADQFMNLYAACMIACERSARAGIFSALRYEDRDVVPGRNYVYRLTPLIPVDSLVYLSSIEVISSSPDDFPPIDQVKVIEGEHYVELQWPKSYYLNYYSAFNIYRSVDKMHWTKLNNMPFAMVSYYDADAFIYTDSLPNNYQTRFYYLEGLTSYATVGPKSSILSGMGRDRTPPDAPFNITTNYLGDSRMEIRWEVNTIDQDIAGFRISKSDEDRKIFNELTEEPLHPEIRTFIDTTCNPYILNYYWVGVVDTAGNVNVGNPKDGNIIDSIPPAPPTGLEGNIDTNGVVTIVWRRGVEIDLKGYYVHYCDKPDGIYMNLTGNPILDTIWHDTIPLNVLNEVIYYKVVAIDHRSNYSPYSTILTLQKPDLVPPESPLFHHSYSDENGIKLIWINSTSEDVQKNVLIRREEGKESFEELYSVSSNRTEDSFLDHDIEPGKTYNYQLYAEDDAGNKSEMVGTVIVKAYVKKVLTPVNNLEVTFDEEKKLLHLTWSYPEASSYHYVIYRSLGSSPFVSYKVLDGALDYNDYIYRSTGEIKYKIKAINQQGWESSYSEEASIIIPEN